VLVLAQEKGRERKRIMLTNKKRREGDGLLDGTSQAFENAREHKKEGESVLVGPLQE
jgi:hypothetical protein